MLKFIAAKEAEAALNAPLLGRTGTRMSGPELASLTNQVISQFLKQVDWEGIVQIYAGGLAGDDDLAIIQRAVRTLMSGGVSYAG